MKTICGPIISLLPHTIKVLRLTTRIGFKHVRKLAGLCVGSVDKSCITGDILPHVHLAGSYCLDLSPLR